MLIPRIAFENCTDTLRQSSVGNMDATVNVRGGGMRKRIREFGKQLRQMMNGQNNATDGDISK
jgi:hypothetical protein